MSKRLTYILSLSVMLVFLFPGSALPHDGETGTLDGWGKRPRIGIETQPCTAFFDTYSTTEIVDALVDIRETWMTIAGVKKIPEMLGKADNRYINAGTVCQDITLAKVSLRQFEDDLRRKRDAREERERWLFAYQQQMQTQRAEIPHTRPEMGDTQRSTTHVHDLDTRESGSPLPVYDTKAYCRKIADVVGGSYQIEETCRQSEQKAQKQLTVLAMPPRISQYCQKIGQTVGGSYEIMLTCVKSETEAKNRM